MPPVNLEYTAAAKDEGPGYSLPEYPSMGGGRHRDGKDRTGFENEGGFPKLGSPGFRARLNAHVMLTILLAISLVVVLGLLIARPTITGPQEVGDLDTGHASSKWAPLPSPNTLVHKIVFGSCMKANMPQPFWDTISNFDPDVTVLAGDNVYLPDKDCRDHICTDLKRAYEDLDAHPSFKGAKATLPMVAIPDDHDYGKNDCHSDNPYKDVAKDLFLDFFDIPLDDVRRNPSRKNEGLYTSYEWGHDGKRVQLILLDTRYSRSEFLYDDDLWGYVPDKLDTSKRMLSETQWSWLSGILKRPANVRLILSTVQVLGDGSWGFEGWGLIPHERQRLKDMLKKYCVEVDSPSLPILLSGDRHIGGFWYDEENDLHEITSSSLTHTFPRHYDPDGLKCHNEEECTEEDPRRVGDWVHYNNFGLVEINWPRKTVDLRLIRSETSEGYAGKGHHEDTDAGEVLRSLSLDVP